MYIAYPDHLPGIKLPFKNATYFEVPKDDPYVLKKIEENSENFSEKKLVLSFISDMEKIIIDYKFDFFHCMIDTLSTILYEYKKNNNLLFLINLSHMPASFFSNTYNIFLFNTLNKLKINYHTVSLKSGEMLYVSNSFYYKNPPMTYDAIIELEQSATDLYDSKNPDKKVYLSRKKMTDTKPKSRIFGDQPVEKFLFADDNRIDNEDKMEDFFKKNGFDIVYPEDFICFEDQVKYFSTVKILVGVTGAGLLNSIFMPRGGTIFEMTTPLIVQGRESIHNFYKDIAFAKDHKYFSMVNFRSSSDVLNSIKENTAIMGLLNE